MNSLLRIAFSLGFCAIALPNSARAQPTEMPPGVKVLAEGFKFPEGPAISPDGTLYFSDSVGSTIYRMVGGKAEVFAKETKGANGLAFAKDGTLYACAGAGKAVVAFAPDGKMRTVLDKVNGAPLNSPNDLALDAAGNIFFSNPFGIGASRAEGKASLVRLKPDGSATEVSFDAVYPNGVDFSPDGKSLYLNDVMGGCVVYRYPVSAGGEIGKGEVFIKFGSGMPDGIAVAESGNVYVALNMAAKIAIVSPEGKPLKEIAFPKGSQLSNVCFGGADMKTLFITMGGMGGATRVVSMPADEPGLKLACCR